MIKFENVSIIIPAINETYLLERTFEIISATCDKSDIKEIILVLCEKTLDECKATADKCVQKYPDFDVKIYYQKKPYLGNAYREAIDFAKGSHVIMAAADMDMDPRVIHKFIEKSKLNPQKIIVATRWMKGGGFHGYNYIKLVLNFIFQNMLKVLFKTKLCDMTYGFRLYPTKLMQAIDWEEERHPFVLETCLKTVRLGMEFEQVPAVWRKRTEGDSQISFFKCFSYFGTVYKSRKIEKKDIMKSKKTEDADINKYLI